MKVMILGDAGSSHTIRWTNALAERNLEVFIVSLFGYKPDEYDERIKIVSIFETTRLRETKSGSLRKLPYLKVIFKIRKLVAEYQPDILHAHYATSYGLLGALAGFHPYIISAWGIDITDFPQKSLLHKKILSYALNKADKVLLTSYYMKGWLKKLTDQKPDIISFGIDTRQFSPRSVDSLFKDDDIVVGTVKAMRDIYGVDYLIKAFKIVKDKYPELPLKLLLVGGGDLVEELKKLTEELKIADSVVFTGYISPKEVDKYHNMIDIFVAISVSDAETFGVAILEASSCGKPVIVSDAGGLPEVVDDGVTGFVVPRRDSVKTAEAIERLVNDTALRKQMGDNGRERVCTIYDWNDSVKTLIDVYHSFLSR